MRTFSEIIEAVHSRARGMKLAVAASHDEETMRAVLRAKEMKIVEPVLFGNKEKIKTLANSMNLMLDVEMINAEDSIEASRMAVESVAKGDADILMKGMVKTSDLMSIFLRKEYKLRTERILSAVSVHEVSTYHKLLIVSDGGMVISPNLQQRLDIVENAVLVAHTLGIEKPRVALLGTGKEDSLTAEIAILSKMFQRRSDCIVDGPFTLDAAISKETGFSDVLIVPHIEAGNILSKALVHFSHSRTAIVVVGGRVPIILTSRADGEETRFFSIVLGVLIAQNEVKSNV
ncbi:phosphate acyltransferase [Thermotoga sp. SG1]|uniref:phosphate acyltransferase n=1 Tax=Thermotoga sp. SG1 TaxID=126739 RepID=UPI000C7725D7|nr:phosphate acyltransferase [Thermotoga sp. SG1]PLV55591.1 phosphate butyryltransferase [Thermotoga sp. SG1]